MEQVQVGLFKLPGIRFEKGQIPEDLNIEMEVWAKENHCGMQMNEWLWSFKTEAQRDWFVFRWSDLIQKTEKNE
jgi:sigma54-dependent transcription regulator